MSISVQSLHIYPLKGARGIDLTSLHLGPLGPQKDRHWMLATKTGQFVSQRTHPKLAQIQTSLEGEELTVSHPNYGSLKIPPANQLKAFEVKLFAKQTHSRAYEADVNQWFSDYFSEDLILCHIDTNNLRTNSNNHTNYQQTIAFPDGYPVLLTSQESLDNLNSKLDEPISMSRFRPNIVVSGIPSEQEDNLKDFNIGGVNFRAVKGCTRCKVIELNPKTGDHTQSKVNLTLKSYKTNAKGQPIFGQNLVNFNEGTINCGDELITSL